MADHDVTVERTVQANPDDVWSALTDSDAVTRWMGAAVTSDWSPGASITWAGEYNGSSFEDHGEVLTSDAPHHLSYSHVSGSSPDGAAHEVDWTLTSEGDGATRLTLVQRGASSADEAEQFESTWRSMVERLAEVAEPG